MHLRPLLKSDTQMFCSDFILSLVSAVLVFFVVVFSHKVAKTKIPDVEVTWVVHKFAKKTSTTPSTMELGHCLTFFSLCLLAAVFADLNMKTLSVQRFVGRYNNFWLVFSPSNCCVNHSPHLHSSLAHICFEHSRMQSSVLVELKPGVALPYHRT